MIKKRKNLIKLKNNLCVNKKCNIKKIKKSFGNNYLKKYIYIYL